MSTSFQQLQQSYGEEKDVMDVDSEEDTSSVSSVEYSYSEEDAPEEEKDVDESDDDEDDDAGDEEEVGMTYFKELQDAALKYSLKLVPDLYPEDFAATSGEEVVPHYTGSRINDAWCMFEEDFPYFKKFWPPLEAWVESWKLRKYHQTHFAWVHVYASYSKIKGHGLYAVIIRDSHTKPVIASLAYSTVGTSFFYQLLIGVLHGVKLAQEEHGFSELGVECNSLKVIHLIEMLSTCRNVKCRTGDAKCICKQCFMYFMGSKGCDPSLVPLVREIIASSPKAQYIEDMLGYSGGTSNNKAAHYLAKMVKENAARYMEKKKVAEGMISMTEWMTPAGRGISMMLQPDQFPKELNEILWEDAHGRKYNIDGARIVDTRPGRREVIVPPR